MPSTISPNMGLIIPGVGTEPGPAWANDLNASLGTLDQHTHAAGQGIQINPNGIYINSDFPINSNNLVTVKTVNFAAQLSFLPGLSPNLGCIYVAGNELYYNDESGNVIPITLNGSVNSGAGSITGLPSGTASASYSSGPGDFVWRSSTLTPANMDGGSVIIREQVPSPNGVTLSSPNSLAASYTLTFPATLPSVTKAMFLDTAGNISAAEIALNNLTPALQGAVNPSGAIIMYAGVSAPAGYLLCDGAAISRTTFVDLFTAIGTAYGVGDGSLTFNVPDLRGLFPRGVDSGAGNDPNAGTRTATNGGNSGDNVGSVQSDATDINGLALSDPGHVHNIKTQTVAVGALTMAQLVTGDVGATLYGSNSATTGISLTTSDNETRPKNVYVNFMIKT